MAEDVAVTALVYDARGAAAGAREFEQASGKIIAANDATTTSTERVQTALGNQQRALNSLERRYDPVSAATRKLESDQKRLNEIIAAGGPGMERAQRLLAQVEQRQAALAATTQQASQATSNGIKATRDAAAAQEAAAEAGRRYNGMVQQASFQVSDFANQVSTGGNVAAAAGMQLGQLLGALGPIGAAMGAVVNVGGVLVGALQKSGDSAASTSTEFNDYAKAAETAAKFTKDLTAASEAQRNTMEAQRRSTVAAREEAIKKAEADLQAAEAGLMAQANSGDASSMSGLSLVYLFKANKAKELRQELEILRASYGLYFDGAREVRISTEQAGKATGSYQEQISALRQSISDQVKDLGLEADTFGKTNAQKLRARLETEAMAKEYKTSADQLSAGTRSLIEQAVAQQRQIDNLERAKDAQEEATKAGEKARKEREKAIEAGNDIIDALRNEQDALALTERERFVQNKALEAERQLRGKLNTEEMAETIRQIQYEAGALYDATKARDDKKKADEEAARAAQKLAEQNAALIPNMFDRAFDRAGDSIVDMVVKGGDALKSLANIGKAVFASLATDAIKFGAMNPLRDWLFGTSSPSLWGAMSPANQNAQSGGMGGAGNLLSGASGLNTLSGGGLMDKLFPGGGFSLTNSIDSFGMGMGFGPGTNFVGPMLPGTQGIFGGASLSQFLGGAGLGMGAGALLNSLVGGNAVGGTIGSGLGGAAGAAIGSIIPGVGTLIGGLIGGAGGGLLGGLFGNNKPSNMEGNVSIDFGTGAATVGGQTGKKFSAENRQAAQGIGGQVQQLAATLEALLPGQQITGKGLVAVGSRDGLRAEYGGQKAEFGKEDAAGLVSWFTKQFGADLKAGFEKGDLTEQVAGNLTKVLDKGITGTVEQFVADMTLAATDFAKAFDSMAKVQPDQAALDLQAAAQSFLVTRDAAEKLKLNIDGLAESFKKGADRALDAQIRAAEGLTGTSSAQVIRASFQTNATALLAAGQDAMKAQVLYGAQMSALVNSFGMGVDALKQLNAMARDLETEDPVAALFARTRAEQVRAAVTEDLTLRQMAAQVQLGQVSQEAYDMAALELQQKRELAGITDESALAMLRQTQATERQALASQQAAKAAQAAAEAQKAFASASSSTRSYLLSLMTGEAGGLSAQDRYRNAQGEYASASAAIGPQATAEQLARQTEAAKALLDASRAVNGSTTEYFRDFANVTGDLAKSAQLTPDDPVVTAINALKSSIDGLGGKIDVQVSVDAINFVRGEIEQTITTHVSLAGLTPREVQLANGILDAVNQSVTVALSPATGLTARELQVYQGALSNIDQSITAIVDTSGLTGANREIALGQLSDATRTINAALGQFPNLTAVEREFVLGTSRDFARVFNAFTGAAPNLTAVQQGILFGISDSFTKTYQQAVGVMPSMTADQQAILMGVSDSFTRTFQAAASAAPTLSAEQLAILKGKTDDFTRTFIAATNDLVLTEDEKAVLAAKDATIRQTVDQFVNRDVTETVSTTVMRDLNSGFQASSLQAASMIIRQLDELGRLVLSGSVNVVRAVTGNYAWGEGELATVLNRAKPTVLSTGAANYIARYADIADAYMRDPTFDPERHYNTTGWKEGRIWEANQSGGIVGSYEGGGIVGNGVRGVDSVLARYAGGGYIHLAGEEGVLTADATSAIGGAGTVDYINRNRALPSMRPVVMPAANSNRASSNGEMVSELRALREEVSALRRENTEMIRKQALMEDAGLKAQTAALATVLSRKSKQAASAA